MGWRGEEKSEEKQGLVWRVSREFVALGRDCFGRILWILECDGEGGRGGSECEVEG